MADTNAAARCALALAAVAGLLIGVALSLTAGGARLAAGRYAPHGDRVQRGVWPGWAHSGAAVHISAPAPVAPDAALLPPPAISRLLAPPPATAAGLPALPTPAFRAVRRPPLTVARPSDVILPVSPPPPRSS